MNPNKTRLYVEVIEDRITPSTGMPWGSNNLTLSFVPDGAAADGVKSSLFQTLGKSANTAAWETAILKAAQTWSSAANLNIGLVADGGQALGATGMIQGDQRFGDIRVAAEPMGLTSHLSVGSPYNPVAGTRSGDIIFNSSFTFGVGTQSNDIYTVALHELGNALGVGENNDPTSVMFSTYTGPRTGLSAGDIATVQSLYGARPTDMYEGVSGNNTLGGAAVIKLPEIAADITTSSDVDFYRYTVPSYADRTIKVTVQSGNVSLLTPHLTIYNASGQVIATTSASDPFSGSASITLNNVKRGTVLFFKVDSASSDVFSMGGYRLKIDSGDVSRKQIDAIDAILNGSIMYTNFGHKTSTLATAASLDQAVYQTDPRFDYAINAKLNDASDINFFSVTMPATAPNAAIFTVAPGQNSHLSAEVTVYDANGQEVDANILSNEASGYVVQLLNPVANAKYYVSVSHNAFAGDCQDKGTYRLGVNYTNTPIILQTIVDDTLSATDTVDVVSLQSTQAQLYHFVLSADTGGAASGIVVVMQIFDSNNNLVLNLVCQDGNTLSADIQLKQGAYTARFIGVSTSGAIIPLTNYSLLGVKLSDPLDPVPVNPTDPTLNPTTTPPATTVVVTSPIVPPVIPPIDPTALLTPIL